jgi:hypothetical protein
MTAPIVLACTNDAIDSSTVERLARACYSSGDWAVRVRAAVKPELWKRVAEVTR